MGNSPKEIRASLTRAEKDPERIQAILAIIARLDRQEQTRQGKKLRRVIGILGLLALLLVGAGFVYQKNLQTKPAQAGLNLQNTQAPNLAVKILNLNTPLVKYGAAPPGISTGDAGTCPHTAGQAASLFGGQPSDWVSPPNSSGWIMIRKGKPADIYVPKGMKAAYLQLGSTSMQLVDVDGPATLSNAYYIAVSCP